MSHDTGRACVCVSEHRPTPQELQRHHVHPLSWGGPDVESNTAWLCPTCHANTHELLRHYQRYEGTPPWEVRRRFNAYTRDLAARGWAVHTGAAS